MKEIQNPKHHFISIILFFVIAGSLVLPMVDFYNVGLRLSDVLILVVLPVLYFFQPSIPKYKIFSFYALFVICTILSLIYGYGFLDVPPSYGDLNEIIKIIMPLLVMLVFVKVDKDFFANLLVKFLYYGSFFIIMVGILEYFFPFGIGYRLHLLYDPNYQLDDCMAGRIFVTGSGPNTGAVIVLLFLQFNVIAFLIRKNFKYFVVAIFLMLTLILTGSRTGIIAVALSALVILILTYKYSKFYNLFILTIMTLLAIVLVPMIPYVYIGLKTLLQGNNTSVLARVGNMHEAYMLFKESIFFGWGPAKSIHPTIVDGEYFLLLRRYGIIGCLSLSLFMTYNIIRILKNMKHFYISAPKIYILSVLVVSYSATMVVVMLTNNFISGYQLFSPYILIVSIVHSNINKIKYVSREDVV